MANRIPTRTSTRSQKNQTHRNYQNNKANTILPTTVFYNNNLLHQQLVAVHQRQCQQYYQQQQRMQLQSVHYSALQAQQMILNANYAYQWQNIVAAQQRQLNYKNYQRQQTIQIFQNIEQQIQQNRAVQSAEETQSSENAPASPCKKKKQNKQDDTVQRNSSKVAHNNNHHHNHHHRKSRKDHQQNHHQQLLKNDSSDSGLSVNVQQQRHHQNQRNNLNNSNQSKSRYIKQHQNGHQRPIQKPSSGFSMDDWLENGEMVYYERRRFISSSDEDKLGRRHNAGHRNSTSSETTPSEDLTTSSSNEDLRDSYTVSPKCKKNISKSRQRRQQQKRKKQLSESGNSNHDENEDAMDVDIGSVKENCRPNNAGMQQRNGMKNSKNSAQKVANSYNNGNKNNVKSGNVLKNSNSNVNSKRTPASSSSSQSSSSAISSSSVENSPTASPTTSKRNAENLKKIALQLAPPLRSYMNMNFTEKELIQHLRRYIIDHNLLRVYGYPVESAIHEGCIEIYKCLPKPQNITSHHHHHHNHNHHGQQQQHQMQQTQNFVSNTSVINANDGLYVNISTSLKREHKQQWTTADDSNHSATDSGQGSGDSSPPSMDSDTSEGAEDEPSGTTALYTPDGSYQIFSQYDQSMEKQCVRCNSTFHVTAAGEYLNRESCTFHWGKLNQFYSGDKGYCFQYTCCQGDEESKGCVYNDLHVWTGAVVGLNGPYTDFVHTRTRYDSTGPTKIYALDCEMSFTGRGLEVTKITVVGYDGQVVYEHFVRPDAEIVDYNTRFSGITEKDLSSNSNKSVKTLTEVQRDLLRLFDADTILIGHGIDNDLRVLRIVHKTIIDTSICFPHASGFPYRRALKHLTKVYLNRDIQTSDAGHSSFEDARACLELMLWKVRKEMR